MSVKFSIIMPCFNVENFIERAVNSCINQTYDNFEVIIVDDGSTDSTISIAKDLARKFNNVKLIINKENIGTFHARKKGFEASGGDLIFFMDPDDSIELDALEIISSSPRDINLFGLNYISSSKRWNTRKFPKNDNLYMLLHSMFKDFRSLNYGNPGKVYKSSLVKKIYSDLFFVDKKFLYSEDVVFFYAAISNAESYVVIERCLYNYYINTTSITYLKNKDLDLRKIEQMKYAISVIKILSLAKEVDYSELFVKELNYSMQKINLNNLDVLYPFAMFSLMKKNFKIKDLLKLIIWFFSFGKIKKI